MTFSNTVVLVSGLSLDQFEFPPHSGNNVASDFGGPIFINFAVPVLIFGGYFTYSAPLTLTAFGAGNNQLARVQSAISNNEALSGNPGSSPNEFLQFAFAGGISKVEILGDPGGGSFTLDDATFTHPTHTLTPEPNTALLLLSAMIIVSVLNIRILRPGTALQVSPCRR